mmetsp:Transcript_2069/g.6264  ORF Transcript_2069/g.6264 Transcript_2069/m.6264 type:complete len:925 (-) Transcript_2069:12-2786(-)
MDLSLPGAFAALCRCGKKVQECVKHVPGDDADRVLLPAGVEPLHYDVALALRFADPPQEYIPCTSIAIGETKGGTPELAHVFDGEVSVTIAVEKQAANVSLHAKDLTIKTASIDGVACAYALDEELSTVTLTPLAPIGKGEHVVALTYEGVLNNLMAGFYRSTYTDINGEKKLMASTQFESIDARRCLPCWDEPRRKATFSCALTVPSHMTALSNMPEASKMTFPNGMTKTSFMATPRMSTYLLCFVVGEFDHVSKTTSNGVLIRAFTPPGKPHLGEFALDCAVAALDAYDRTFEIPYPLPKSDMVAIPEFAAGAMENWGLVTYREVDMLIDKKTASSRQLQRVAEVVIHELAHQWFGNLVTMEWWEDLWLNEGFATWMETGVCAELYPEWSMWEQFITDMQGRALQLDALRSSHPIQVPIRKAEEVEQVFDAISYCKGGSVVRMVHAVVGAEAFVKGLRAYMKEFAYGNATTADLWAAWELASGKPVTEMMDAWTKQTGFPVLELVGVRGDGTLDLKQYRFFADGAKAEGDDALIWPVPLFAAAPGAPETSLGVMKGSDHAAPFPAAAGAAEKAWVKLNAGQHAPLRCKYPDAMLPALAQAIRAKTLPAADRIGLLSDAAALSKAGLLGFVRFLELLGAFKDEDDATVWSMVLEKLLALGKTLRGADERCAALSEAYDAFARSLLLPALNKVGWEPREKDAHLDRKLRGEVIAALPTFCGGDAGVVAEAQRRFDAFRGGDDAALPSEYQSAVYKLVLSAGDAATFDQILGLFESRPLNEEKKSCLVGLGAAPTDALRTKALDFALSDAVKLQDYFYVALATHGASTGGRDSTWAHFQAKFAAHQAKVGEAGSSLMDAVVVGACSGFSSEAKATEILAFFEANPLPRNERKISQTVEAIRASAKYVERVLLEKDAALGWLRAEA